MNGRRAIIGLCMLCALMVSAFAAQSASATTGTTAFTCKEGAGVGTTYTTDHCKPAEAAGKFGHFEVAQNTTTEVTGNNNGQPGKFKSTVGGVGITLTATGLTVTGWMENKIDVGTGEHYAQGEGAINYSGVTVNVPNCFVYKDEAGVRGEKEKVDTEKIIGTTTGQGDSVKFTPKAEEVLARFWILDNLKKTAPEGGACNIGATYNVTGSVTGKPDGATIVFTHTETTTQNTLKLNGAKAGYEGVVALEGRDPTLKETTYTPLSPTTVT